MRIPYFPNKIAFKLGLGALCFEYFTILDFFQQAVTDQLRHLNKVEH